MTRNEVGPVPIEEMSEENLLKAIWALAVKEENPKVARVALTQDRGEPVRAFAARLCGQAEVCRFVKACTGCDRLSNQGEERVADQFCVGLADAEIQEDLLKHSNQDMGVEETIRFVEIRAAGKRSAASMTTPTTASAIDEEKGGEAITSNYRRLQRRPTRDRDRPRPPPPDLELPPQTTPSPKSRATPTREQPQPRAKEATPPEPHPLTGAYAPSAARQDMESRRGRPTGDYTAQPSAPPARHAESRTTQPTCAGIT